MSEGVERFLDWCDDADLTWRAKDGTVFVRLDPDDPVEVRLEQDGEDQPLRLHDEVALPDDLPAERLAEVVEDVVLGRSSLVDARPTPDGDGAEVVLVVHADGLNRHAFLEAVYELQKVRLLLYREVRAAAAAEQAVAALSALAEQASASAPA